MIVTGVWTGVGFSNLKNSRTWLKNFETGAESISGKVTPATSCLNYYFFQPFALWHPCCLVPLLFGTSGIWPSSFWQNTQHQKQHAVFLSKKRKYQWWAWNNFSHNITCTSVADSENQIKIRHRNLESRQNDNISKSVGETSLKQEKIQKRSKSTKSYIHFHNFSESSEKNFNVVSHRQMYSWGYMCPRLWTADLDGPHVHIFACFIMCRPCTRTCIAWHLT